MNKEVIDTERRQFLRFLTTILGGVAAIASSIPFLSYWMPSRKARAEGAPKEVDLSELEPGQRLVVEWRGKPVWVIRRDAASLKHLDDHNEQLRDPDSQVDQQPDYAQNKHRSINKEFLVLVGVCTHLGCAPVFRPKAGSLRPGWPGGFYCPCHGSAFDMAGRVFKGVPAPINLEVPPHKFVGKDMLLIGVDHDESEVVVA